MQKFLTISEVHKIIKKRGINISLRTLSRRVKQEKLIPVAKSSHIRLFDMEAIENFIELEKKEKR